MIREALIVAEFLHCEPALALRFTTLHRRRPRRPRRPTLRRPRPTGGGRPILTPFRKRLGVDRTRPAKPDFILPCADCLAMRAMPPNSFFTSSPARNVWSQPISGLYSRRSLSQTTPDREAEFPTGQSKRGQAHPRTSQYLQVHIRPPDRPIADRPDSNTTRLQK